MSIQRLARSKATDSSTHIDILLLLYENNATSCIESKMVFLVASGAFFVYPYNVEYIALYPTQLTEPTKYVFLVN